ncbi:DUF1801 domain-containing protein [Paenibacillus soyae]|uniref:DUF1801 domain-containing protein n=1 Tax=Paenibacillus soyae TaxID=2969249 RepID=A0A9X2SBK6_9BACL|nr:DUF1801 domain-containing protein [Paenibacillus soyae]MCR2807351.1 DUF1801 domain-containing protein [Paenibacillus soyae]
MSTAEVEAWLQDYEHPLKDVMLHVRQAVMAADPRMQECIKWKSPTFTYQGNLASFNPRTKKHVSLMFHTGASISNDFPNLQGGGDTARYMAFHSMEEAEARRGELEAIVRVWCSMKG